MTIHDDHLHLRPHVAPTPPHELAPLLKAAGAAGFAPGIREHPPLPGPYRIGPHSDYDYAMREHEVERFFDLFVAAGRPVGFEFDYIAGFEEEQKNILDDMTARAQSKGVPVSGVIGSVHFLPGDIVDVEYEKSGLQTVMWDLDENVFRRHLKNRGAARMIRDYFGAQRELIGMKTFDVLGHIELIRKFDTKDSNGDSIYFADVEDLYMELARGVIELLAESPMALEINTAGMFAKLGRPYISQELLNYAVEAGVPTCYGSDSHLPERVGAGWDIVARMLERAGRERLVTFDNRKMIEYSWVK